MTVEKMSPFGLCLRFDETFNLENIEKQELQNLLKEHKLILIRGLSKPNRDELLSFCESFPQTRTLNWSFGPVMEMKESEEPQNYLFSREAVPFHWDGAFHFVPDYLVFSCVQAPVPGAGGETLFANTELILQTATDERKNLWSQVELKYETAKIAHYGGSICGPLLQKHPLSGNDILRFAESVETSLNPVTLNVVARIDINTKELVADLTNKIYAPEFCYRHAWQDGDLLLADNHSLIHGRTAFEKNCPRHLRRIQLIKE